VTDFVAIAVHANEQCENRCGFVASRIVAAIADWREIKLFSAEYRNSHKLFQTSTKPERYPFAGFASRVYWACVTQGAVAMTQQTERKVRDDLTEEEKTRLEKYGAIAFKSARPAWDSGTAKFIPSREQH